MWVLMLMLVTAKGQLIMYDQGIFKTADECLSTRIALEEELKDTNYRLTCFKWKDDDSKK